MHRYSSFGFLGLKILFGFCLLLSVGACSGNSSSNSPIDDPTDCPTNEERCAARKNL